MKMFYEVPVTNVSLEEMTEQEKVRRVVEYERYCCDYGLKEQQGQQWFDDGILFTTWFKGNVREYLNSDPAPVKPGEEMASHAHRINNTVVWLNGNRAIAEIVLTLNFRSRLQGEWVDIQCFCRMHYRVEKRRNRWGIVYMEGIYEKDRMDTVFGDSDFRVPEAQLREHRPINWNMAIRRGKYLGHETNEELWAGRDRPETIQRLYEDSSSWFYAS